MFSFIGRLFGSQKSGEKLIDGAMSGIDKMFYTDQEKAEDGARAKREVMALYMEWMKSTSGSRVARRFIALIITLPWAFAHTLSMIMDAVAPFIQGVETIKTRVDGQIVEQLVMRSDKFAEAADSLSTNANENNALVGVVLLFYFGGPHAIDGVKGLVTKWTEKKNVV